jgi:hypothetical protein
MSEYLKGNYKMAGDKPLPAPQAAPASSSEQTFEAQALQKLGGSIAFIKKSSSFVWSGGKKDDARPTSR